MSGRTLLSRPRTRIYDVNYNIGQNYYRPALDRLDRKYSPRPPSPLNSSIANDILSRHAEAFAEEDLTTARRRAEKRISENNVFDFRGRQIAQNALDLFENDREEEVLSASRRTRSKRESTQESSGMESTINSISSQRLLDRSQKALESVGINESSRAALNSDISMRSLKVSFEGDSNVNGFVKWSPIQRQDDSETAAAIRARKSRDRLQDLEDEMQAVAEKQAARERRAARFKALVAESTEETEAAQTAIKALSVKARRERVVVE